MSPSVPFAPRSTGTFLIGHEERRCQKKNSKSAHRAARDQKCGICSLWRRHAESQPLVSRVCVSDLCIGLALRQENARGLLTGRTGAALRRVEAEDPFMA